MKATLFLITVLLTVAVAPSCAHKPDSSGTPIVGGLVDCGTDVVSRCAPQALGPVNTCLASVGGDWQGCLAGLIGPAECAAEAVVACVVRRSGSGAAAEVAVNPGNEVSERMAARARDWIATHGYSFAGPK